MTDEIKCSHMVYGGWNGYRGCSRRATVLRDGKWYCHQHDPVEVKRRDAERRAKWEAKWKRMEDNAKKRERAYKALDLLPGLRSALEAAIECSITGEPIADDKMKDMLAILKEARDI